MRAPGACSDKAISTRLSAERALAATPEDAAALDTRGSVYLKKGRPDLAMADFDKAVALDPTLIEVYRDRGLAHEANGDRDKALADYRKALSLKPRWAMEYKAQEEVLQHLTSLAAASPRRSQVLAAAFSQDRNPLRSASRLSSAMAPMPMCGR